MISLIKKDLELIDEYRNCCVDLFRSASINSILEVWAKNKQEMFKLLGNQISISKEVVIEKNIEITEKQISDLFSCDKDSASRKFIENYWKVRDNIQVDKWTRYDIDYLFNPRILAENIVNLRDTIIIPRDEKKPVIISNGMKTMKAIAKIAELYEIEGFEDFRLAHSQILNDKKMKGKLTLSIHPLDYMTMSDNNCGWSSCMSWLNEGCYRQGTVEMMNSPTVIVAYLESEQPMKIEDNLEFSWNNKKWRELFIVDKGMIVPIKAYPYPHKELELITLNWLHDLAKENLEEQYEDTIRNIYLGQQIELMIDNVICFTTIKMRTGYMYNDFSNSKLYPVYFSKRFLQRIKNEVEKTYRIYYSGPAQCMNCGAIIDKGEIEDGGLCCTDCS